MDQEAIRKKLKKNYKKQTKSIIKKSMESGYAQDILVVLALKLLEYRDINEGRFDETLEKQTLIEALAEYSAYVTCMTNYFNEDGSVIKDGKLNKMNKDDVIDLAMQERYEHWCNFFDLVFENIDSWDLLFN